MLRGIRVGQINTIYTKDIELNEIHRSVTIEAHLLNLHVCQIKQHIYRELC